MAINKRREIEVKAYIGENISDLVPFRDTLINHGFTFEESRIETDYLPDTDGGDCKRNGILLRFRKIERFESTSWLLTLKRRLATEGVTAYEEIETTLNHPHHETYSHINKVLNDLTGHNLPPKFQQMPTLENVVRSAQDAGFTATRILLDKYRESYVRDRDRVTLDYFPEGMGGFLEIESYSIRDLHAVRKLLRMTTRDVTSTDYGDLLKEHMQRKGAKNLRKALFTEREKHRLMVSRENT